MAIIKTIKKHKCIPHYMVFTVNGGNYEICRKCNPRTGVCSDSGQECPYMMRGVKWIPWPDSTELPDWMKDRASRGGKRSHGLE